jgi:hypothetical protein
MEWGVGVDAFVVGRRVFRLLALGFFLAKTRWEKIFKFGDHRNTAKFEEPQFGTWHEFEKMLIMYILSVNSISSQTRVCSDCILCTVFKLD